ncbi:MAG: Zn-ribbon domain-containing OB-fold protein [Thaumarchaeota archaeon]|nr:Zn-ribbon domain-containing OB-fold protein [Nitrososphaerota archaeon]
MSLPPPVSPTQSPKLPQKKPTPDIFPFSEAFWEGTNKGELRIQVCTSCSHRQWYPKASCENCGKREFSWLKCSGKGKVRSFTIIREVVMNSPAFEAEIPYALSILELDEGVRFVGQIVGAPPEDIRVGMEVEAFFEKINGVSVVKFSPNEGLNGRKRLLGVYLDCGT